MSSVVQTETNGSVVSENKDNSAERNFANLRKKAEHLEQEKEEYRKKAEDLEKEKKEWSQRSSSVADDDDDDEPYVTPKKLKKEQNRYGEQFEKRVAQTIEQKVEQRLDEERKTQYLKENSDFNAVLSEDSVKDFIESHSGLAQAILGMPDTFERKKLVYETIKSLKHTKDKSKSEIQGKIDQNRKSPYYKPSTGATPPYGGVVDGASAYKQMQDLKSRLRLS